MNRSLVTLVLVAAALAACGDDDASESNPASTTSDEPAAPTAAPGISAPGPSQSHPNEPSDGANEPTCDSNLDKAFGAWAEAGFSGSIAISTGGEADCLVAYGWADAATRAPNTVDTVFHIGSITKAFTAAAVFDLVDDGELSLDDRAGDLLSDLDGPVADATVEQLLLHTGGLIGTFADDHEPLARDAALAAIGELEVAFEPGSDFLYSNAGYTLLALIIDEVSGSYREHTVSEILSLPDGHVAGGFWDGEPAAPGPRAVGYLDEGPTDQMGDFDGPHWAVDGNGALAMTTQDLASWTHALFTGQIVSTESVEAMSTSGFDHGDGTAEARGWVRMDRSILGEPVFTVAGGGGDVGHNVIVAWLPESERVIAMASNTPDVTAEAFLQTVGPSLLAGDPLPVPDAPEDNVESADPAELAAVAGVYRLASGGSFDVTVRDDGLAVAANGTDAVEALFPPAGGFTVDDVADHEERVMALLAGETQEGRAERKVLEADLGAIDDIQLAGTIVDDGELRTHVTVTAGGTSHRLWYALNDRGGIEAAQVGVEPPTSLLIPVGEGGYRPRDLTGVSADVMVEFDDDDHMTVTGSSGELVADRPTRDTAEQ